ncbi:tyrosine-type recombinase/integrase [Luteimonas aestuarii]|nr:site-specific integrase [Luteimonas aestuarii]
MNAVVQFRQPHSPASASLADFACTWFDQVSIGWRVSTQRRVGHILQRYLLPELKMHRIDGFDRAALMGLRLRLARESGCSTKRINAVLQVLAQCLGEREYRYGIVNPGRSLPPLPVARPQIQPFTLPELQRLRAAAPAHLSEYVWIRGLVGLRSGEANGLCWDCVDRARRTLEVRRARADGRESLPKTASSQRLIPMCAAVAEAFDRQWQLTGSVGGYVFLSRRGRALDIQNFARRDWRRILEAEGLAFRGPEQLRHTAATLMLAAGEAPTFVAQVLGHADCRMLLTIYARHVAGATGRRDGVALEAMLRERTR